MNETYKITSSISISERNSPQGNASSRGGGSANNRRQQNNYHNHRQLGQIEGNSVMFTPPDRFLARSHLVEVKIAPTALLNGSKWDTLSQMVWDQFFVNQQTEETYKKKMYLWRYLYLCVRVRLFCPKCHYYLLSIFHNL